MTRIVIFFWVFAHVLVISYFVISCLESHHEHQRQRQLHRWKAADSTGESPAEWKDRLFVAPRINHSMWACSQLLEELNKQAVLGSGYFLKRKLLDERVSRVMQSQLGLPGLAESEDWLMTVNSLLQHPLSNTPTVCCVGEGTLYGAFMALETNANVTVILFDVERHTRWRSVIKFLVKLYQGRLAIVFRNLTNQIREFHDVNPHVTCDLVLLDGHHGDPLLHTRSIYDDFLPMGNKHSVIMEKFLTSDVRSRTFMAWDEAKRDQVLVEMWRCLYEGSEHGLVAGRFNPDVVQPGMP